MIIKRAYIPSRENKTLNPQLRLGYQLYRHNHERQLEPCLFALYKPTYSNIRSDGKWLIVHVPTGVVVTVQPTFTQAKALARYISMFAVTASVYPIDIMLDDELKRALSRWYHG